MLWFDHLDGGEYFIIEKNGTKFDSGEKLAFALTQFFKKNLPTSTCSVLECDDHSGMLEVHLYANDTFVSCYLDRYFLSKGTIYHAQYHSRLLSAFQEKKRKWIPLLLNAKLIE